MIIKKTALLILAAVAVSLGIAALGYFKATPGAKSGATSGAKIEITPVKYDFGNIQYGQIVNYDFTVKNAGNEILKIKRVATSCSCTTAKVSLEKISPQETATLSVRYDSGAMGSAHGKGKQERIIYVRSNDALTPQIEVMIYANVQ